MRAILWHSVTRIRGQPRLPVRTMRFGGHSGLYFSGGSSSIPDETSSGFCSSGQEVMSFGGSTVDISLRVGVPPSGILRNLLQLMNRPGLIHRHGVHKTSSR
jgi:hypothetical protein